MRYGSRSRVRSTPALRTRSRRSFVFGGMLLYVDQTYKRPPNCDYPIGPGQATAEGQVRPPCDGTVLEPMVSSGTSGTYRPPPPALPDSRKYSVNPSHLDSGRAR